MESPPPSKLFSNYSSVSSMEPSLATSSGGGGSSVGDGGLGYIEHTVTKFDTLAGVAIKYGVEVADVKKMNGLTTDLQMFSRKTLHIPLPGRHPPSPIMSNGYDIQGAKKSETTPPNRRHSDLFDSIKSLKLSSPSSRTVSPSMDALRDYYGLKPTDSERSINQPKPPPSSQPPPIGLHRKCRSLANGLSETRSINGDLPPVTNRKKPDSDTLYGILIKKQKSEIDLQNHTPETMLKPNTTTVFSPVAGKGLALRPTAASRTAGDSGDGDSLISDTFSGVKKSSSSPSFQDSCNNNSNNNNCNNCISTSSIWANSVLNLTADIQALSTAAITRPIFDGLPKPISGRKNKAAID